MLILQDEFYHWWLDVLRMRRYIRHPACVPLKFVVENVEVSVADHAGDQAEANDDASRAYALRDVSEGGLCFSSDQPVEPGSSITIEIPVESPPFRAKGVVAWCRPEEEHYAVGVQFNDYVTRFSVRMVEQVCHIERYRTDVEETEGRRLTSEEAAREWIARFGGEFPGCN